MVLNHRQRAEQSRSGSGNVHNMGETGVLLSVMNSLKVLVSTKDPRKYRGTVIKRALITAIEYISADDRHLDPLINWLSRIPISKYHYKSTCFRKNDPSCAHVLEWLYVDKRR